MIASDMAEMVVICDKDKRGEPEDIFSEAWLSAKRVRDKPWELARSLPFDCLIPLSEEYVLPFYDRLLASPLVSDSAQKTFEGPPHCLQFINFYLPGVVNRDSWDGTPISIGNTK